jgi:hypothetical protein
MKAWLEKWEDCLVVSMEIVFTTAIAVIILLMCLDCIKRGLYFSAFFFAVIDCFISPIVFLLWYGFVDMLNNDGKLSY